MIPRIRSLDVAERPRLTAVAEHRDRPVGQRLAQERGDRTAVVRAHPAAVSVEDPHDRRVDALLTVVGHRQRLGVPLRLVVHPSRADRVDVAPVRLPLRMLLRIAVDLARRRDQKARALGLGQPERVMGAVGADLQRVQRQAQVVDRRGGRGEVVDEVDGLVDEVRLDDVHADVHEQVGVADVLDVGQRAGLEVVHADHAVAAREQLVAQMRSEETGAAGDQAGGHGEGYPCGKRRTYAPGASRELHHRAVLIIWDMASTEEHLTVAPIVGPDDPRRFTDSGIEISRSTPRPTSRRASSWASPASTPTRAESTARCTASRPGRCVSTPDTPRRRSPTTATATSSPRARPDCRWPSTCRRSSDSTLTIPAV